jgi:hypothetical protein
MRIRTPLHPPPKFMLLGFLAAPALVACGGLEGSGGAGPTAQRLGLAAGRPQLRCAATGGSALPENRRGNQIPDLRDHHRRA